MVLKFHKSTEPESTPAKQIAENIRLGLLIADIYSTSKYYSNLRKNQAIGKIIRDCNGTLGQSGSLKNGCLYREKGLNSIWKRGDEKVVCDHAVPISELVRRYNARESPIEKLILSPVVRIRAETDKKLTKKGFAKSGIKPGFPLYRYSLIPDIEIVTHKNDGICLESWTEQDHWELIISTEELFPILDALNLR